MLEPIPDNSHIFGSTWYNKACQKYGMPTEDVIQFAVKHQQQAREGFDPSLYASANTTAISVVTSKKGKPSTKQDETKEDEPSNVPKEPKEPKKPKKTRETPSRTPKTTLNPYSSLVQQNNSLVYKEVCLPTHIENTIEELDTDDFEIEYVTLQPFDVHGTSYFRDKKKNKLYKNVKNKIGEYVGRYDPDREIIHTDLPDSDAEDDQE